MITYCLVCMAVFVAATIAGNSVHPIPELRSEPGTAFVFILMAPIFVPFVAAIFAYSWIEDIIKEYKNDRM